MTATTNVRRPSHLYNPLASSVQLQGSASEVDGVPRQVEAAVIYESSRMIQAASVVLRLPQEISAQAIIILQRFWAGADGGSMLEDNPRDVNAAALYLSAKQTAYSLVPRRLLTAFAFVESSWPHIDEEVADSDSRLSQADYELRRDCLYKIETHVLRVLGFQTHIALPYNLCINYLQTLDTFQSSEGDALLAKRAFAHLNTALFSPQLLYLAHQPPALAVAAIYLAARELGVKLPGIEWWRVFDVDREQLGFLVLALQSLPQFFANRPASLTSSEMLTSEALQKHIDSITRV